MAADRDWEAIMFHGLSDALRRVAALERHGAVLESRIEDVELWRHPKSPEPSLTSFRLVIPDHAKGLPVLRALSLCTCCRHYPGTATGGQHRSSIPVVSTFPGMAARSACASSVSRFARRSLALRPAHSRCHRILWPAIRRLQPFRYLHSCSGCFRLEHFAGWGFHPLESAAFARRTP